MQKPKRRAANRPQENHGMCRHPIYQVWSQMRARCYNDRHKSFANYGGRGITVCDEWDLFSEFAKWAFANGYAKGLTLERVDNDGGYGPDNCEWATYTVQAHNRRNTVGPDHIAEMYAGFDRNEKWGELVKRLSVSMSTVNYYNLRWRADR